MLTHNIADMTAKIDAHRAADLLVQGQYFNDDTGKGCFIGCLAHKNDATVLADEYGIPAELTRVLEGIFEALPKTEAADFFSAIPRAIGFDKKDLSLVVWQFLAEELRALPKQPDNIQAVIDHVIAGMDLKASGQAWPRADAYAACAAADVAYAAARAAYAAADTATYAVRADVAARAAARAAYAAAATPAARMRQSDTILKIIAAAPVIA